MDVPLNVVRYHGADSYFGRSDRFVLVVPKCVREEYPHDPLAELAMPIEEYIAEQLEFDVVGNFLVLRDDQGITYDAQIGLLIPETFDRPFGNRANDVQIKEYRWRELND